MAWNYIARGWTVFFLMYFICFTAPTNPEKLLISWEVLYLSVEERCFLPLLVSLPGLSLSTDVYCFCYEVSLFENESNVSAESESGHKAGAKRTLVLSFPRANPYTFAYWDLGKLKTKYKFCAKTSMATKLRFSRDLFPNLNKTTHEVRELQKSAHNCFV